MTSRKVPDLTKIDPLVYKKRSFTRGFWTSTDPNPRYPISTSGALLTSFAFWPVTTWFWTKSIIWPIFTIPLTTALFVFSIIYLDSGLYLLIGCLSTFLGVGVNSVIMLQNSGSHFEPAFNIKEWNPKVYGEDE